METINPSPSQQNQDIQQNVNAPAPLMGNPNMGAPNAPNFAPSQPNVTEHPDAFLGRAFRALSGHNVEYKVDPQGQTVATESAQKPGSFWKNLIAAAVIGGAAGANGNPELGFAGGAIRGGAAEIDDQRKQDLLKRQQAEQEFQNSQQAAKEDREARSFETQEKVRQAQIAQANAETLRTNMLTQGENYKTHSLVADAGKTHFADYDTAGLQPIFKNIPESEMKDTIANRPGASAFDWEPTGVKTRVDPTSGNPTYEYVYSAYDPKGSVPVSAGTLAQWKKDGMDKVWPEIFNIVSPGKSLDAQQYIALKKIDSQLFNDALTRGKAQRDNDEGVARIKLQNAQAAHALAEATNARLQGQQIKEGKTQAQAFSIALEELNKADGDFTKLSPKSKILIGESTQKMMGPLVQEIRDAINAGQDDRVPALMHELDDMRHLSTQAMFGNQGQSPEDGNASGEMVSVTLPNGQSGKIPSANVRDFLAKHPGATVAGKQPAKQQNKIEMLDGTGLQAPAL